ncbi:MAG: HNH endonuclease signature motif containing protein [Bdellovibrionota bacterium]
MVQTILAIILSLSISSYAFIDSIKPKVPNEVQTPGELCDQKDPDFAELRYQEKIPYCQRNVSYFQRTAIYEEYKVPVALRGEYTIDHLIPLSIGGSNDSSNLWPEHRKIKALRPYLEQEVFNAVRDGQLTQKKAIQIILEAKLNPEKFH